MSKKEGRKEKLSVEPYKGVRDFYPEDQAIFNYLVATMREVVERFGYVEYHASILEHAELYKAKGAENEELANEQTYSFIDRGGREVTLRPEMTPTVARMVSARRREFGFPLRLYSIPNVFRYERPQRGRLREHWQLNVDIFGSNSSMADAEIIEVAHKLMMTLGAEEKDFTIKLGSRNFLDRVISKLGLSEESGKKLIGLMDRRAKMPHADFERDVNDIGVALEMLSPQDPPEDVKEVLEIVKNHGIGNAVFDPSIVRGFNYYTGVVFEIFDTHPENNRSVFGGGRYDNLTNLFDDEPIAAVGCATGDAALRDFLAVRNLLPDYTPPTKVYIATTSPELINEASSLAEALRKENVAVASDFGEKKLGDQIKNAAKNNIPYVLIVGEDELKSGEFVVRDLKSGEEKKLSREQLSAFFLNL